MLPQNEVFMPTLSRRQLLRTVGSGAIGVPLAAALGGSRALAQGRCMLTLGTPECNTTAIRPVLRADRLAHDRRWTRSRSASRDYKKEAAFYTALMGWTLRSDDGKQAVMDVGNWGTVIFKPGEAARRRRRWRRRSRQWVESFGFVIDPGTRGQWRRSFASAV